MNPGLRSEVVVLLSKFGLDLCHTYEGEDHIMFHVLSEDLDMNLRVHGTGGKNASYVLLKLKEVLVFMKIRGMDNTQTLIAREGFSISVFRRMIKS